jgi:RNA polymerase sigma factor (sigma-70 family)
MTNSAPEETLTVGERRAWGHRDGASEAVRDELVDVLFRRHYLALLRLGVVMLGSREAAEDAVQDAFLALHRHRSTLRDPEAAQAYLRSAVINRCRSWIRRQVTQRASRPILLVRDQQDGLEDRVVGRNDIESLVTVMRTLARRQREVLACRYVLELSVVETAELLQISEGSVKTHTHRGLKALQERIEVTA